MTKETPVKALIGIIANPLDLIGVLVDEDVSKRVRGAIVLALVALGGWLANDYMSDTLTKEDITPLIVNQRINTEMLKQNTRELCRERGNAALKCEDMVERMFQAIESQVEFSTSLEERKKNSGG